MDAFLDADALFLLRSSFKCLTWCLIDVMSEPLFSIRPFVELLDDMIERLLKFLALDELELRLQVWYICILELIVEPLCPFGYSFSPLNC